MLDHITKSLIIFRTTPSATSWALLRRQTLGGSPLKWHATQGIAESANLGGQQSAQIVLIRIAIPPIVVGPLHVAPLGEDLCQLLVLCYYCCVVPPATLGEELFVTSFTCSLKQHIISEGPTTQTKDAHCDDMISEQASQGVLNY